MANEIGKRIEASRKEKGITQEEMSKYLGVTQSNYGRLEKNDKRISVVKILLIAKILKTTVPNLLGIEGISFYSPSNINVVESPKKITIIIDKDGF